MRKQCDINFFKCNIIAGIGMLLLFFVSLFTSFDSAAQAKLTVSTASAKVGQNEVFQLTYTLSGGSAEQFAKPSFSGFSVIGTSHSSGGGMTVIVNGKVVQGGEGEESWIYQLMPSKTGKFTIDAAKAKVKGQWISSNTVSVEVTASSQKNQQNQQNKQNQQGAQNDGSISGDDIFIRASVDRSNCLQGEQITLVYKIYTRVSISQYAINKLPSFAGFWSQDLVKDKTQNPKQYNETVNGQKYMVAEIRRVALFPQKAGRLTIEPLEVECLAQVLVKNKNSAFDKFFNDPFFNNPFFSDPFSQSYQNVKKTVKSGTVTINVGALPELNKPDGFSGAVGNFSMKADVDKTSVKANEAVNLKFTISGTGNLSLIDKLNVTFPADFETYDPQISDNITINGTQVGGTREFSYLVIPRTPGDFTIKPVTFSYFDPAKKGYVTLTSGEFKIKVGKGDGSAGPSYSGKEDVKYIGSDIRFIQNKPFTLYAIGAHFYNSPLYVCLMLLPFILFILFVIIWRRRLRLRSDVALMKLRKATAVALKRLRTADKLMKAGERENFYVEISRALWGYLGDKFNIPPANLSMDSARETLMNRNVDEELILRFGETLDDCEYARFAPADMSLSMKQMYKKAVEVISKLEQVLK
ncbi:MAG: BatD family protein [Bacteroidota bacterium]